MAFNRVRSVNEPGFRRKAIVFVVILMLSTCLVATFWRASDLVPYSFLRGAKLLRARIDPGLSGKPSTAFLVYAEEFPISEVLPAARAELGGRWKGITYVPAPGTSFRQLSSVDVEDLGCEVPAEQRGRLQTDGQGCLLSTPTLSVSVRLFDTLTDSGVRWTDYPAPPPSADALVIIIRPATAGDRVRAMKDWLRRSIHSRDATSLAE